MLSCIQFFRGMILSKRYKCHEKSKMQKKGRNCTQQMTVLFSGLCIGIGVGFLRHLHVTKDFVIDIVCADYVINTTLAAIRFTANKYEMMKKIPEPEIYHVTSKGFYLTSGRMTFFLFPYRTNKNTFLSIFFSKLRCCFFLRRKKENKKNEFENEPKFIIDFFSWCCFFLLLEKLGRDSTTIR